MAAAGRGGGVSRQGVGRATPAAAAVREKGSSSSSAYVQCRDLVGKSRGGAGGWGGDTAASQHSALQQQLRLGAFGLAALAHALVSQQPVCAGEALHAALALVGLLAAVHALMALQVVLLDEAHVAHVALKGLLAGVDEDVPLEVVTATERPAALLADEVLVDPQLEGAVLLDHHHLFNGLFGLRRLRRLLLLSAAGLLPILTQCQHVGAAAPLPALRLLRALLRHHLLAGHRGHQADAGEPFTRQQARLSHLGSVCLSVLDKGIVTILWP